MMKETSRNPWSLRENGTFPLCFPLVWSLMGFIGYGCATEDILTEEIHPVARNPEEVSTYNKVAVTKCVDYFAGAGGYEEYKGTRCWTEWVDAGSGGGALGSGEYYPGNYPSTGGSGGSGDSGWRPGTTQSFNYSQLEHFYAPGSTPQLEFKSKLNDALIRFYQQAEIYEKVFNLMLQNHVKIKFVLKPSIDKPYYDRLSKTIYLKDDDSFSVYKFSEEMLHAAQHQCFYGSTMDMQYKNYEFEVKVFYDLAHKFYVCTYPGVEYLPTYSDPNKDFEENYKRWIDENVYSVRFFPPSQISEFNAMCDIWKGYAGKNQSNFRPQLILHFFNKPIPEHM